MKLRIVLALIVAVSSAAALARPLRAADPSVEEATPTADDTLLVEEASIAAFEAAATTLGALGFYTDRRTDEFVVVVPESVNQAAIKRLHLPGIPIRIQSSPLSADDLSRAEEGLRLLASDSASGDSISFWFDPERGKIVARGTMRPDVIARGLDSSADDVEYSQAQPWVRSSRHSDTAPFWGGAETKLPGSPNPFDCTTGFSVKNGSGTRFLVTAGHCFAPNASPISPGNGLVQGKVVFRAPFPQFDVERIGNKTYGTNIYVGGAGGVSMVVKGATNPVTGRPIYCHSGAATFEKCNHTVTSLNGGQACDDAGCTNGLMVFDKGDGSTCDGDSGAPFYLKSGGFAYIRGMVVGGEFFCNGSSTGHLWSTISTQLGVSIVTG